MTPNTGTQKRRVFIVDDHPLVREWLSNLINQQSDLAVCGEAATAAQATQAVAALNPDVAVVDIALKDSSGIELIKDLKQISLGKFVTLNEKIESVSKQLSAWQRSSKE